MNTDTLSTSAPISRKKSFNFGSFTIIAIALSLFIFLSFASDTFLSTRNIYSILYGVSFQFFAIIGFTYLMIMGEIDLSVGSVYAFSGMFMGYLMVMMKVPLLPAMGISLLVCVLMGMLTGFLVVRFRLNSMMVTIATLTLIRGLSSYFVKAMYGATYPPAMRHLSKIEIGDVYITIIAMVVLVIVLEILLKKSAMFKRMYFVGENRQTARIYGIKSDRIKIAMFAISALAAAVGGILISSRVSYADTAIGLGLEFQLLTAAVLGGASLYGGKGSILGSCIGLIFLATILNGMVIFNIEPLLQQLIIGVILIISVFIDTRLNKNN
ncbi:MAG: ABC transporter permease [Anaerolineaceae bacterium]|jgi:ribose transport system permease protein|nr:ABC transporter permease [Anaerolineaceae bacterium]